MATEPTSVDGYDRNEQYLAAIKHAYKDRIGRMRPAQEAYRPAWGLRILPASRQPRP